MSHTPGPWMSGRPDMQTIVDGYGSKYVYSKRDNPDDEIALAISFGGDIESLDTIMANALLIAAAPDLLEALEWYVANDDTMEMSDNAVWLAGRDKAIAAIKKAKGA
jgi:hypothetical protein